MSAHASPATPTAEPAELRPVQLAWLAAAVFVVSAGYGALLPLLPAWLISIMPGTTATEVARHVGFLSGVYAAGALLGALLWGVVSDRVGPGRILILGLLGYVASLLLLLVPSWGGLGGIYVLRGSTGFSVAAVVPVVSALVAEHTPDGQRARRFAWLSAMSLLGFLFGPALSATADWIRSGAVEAAVSGAASARSVIVLSALLGAVIMLGLARTLPASRVSVQAVENDPVTSARGRGVALLCVSGALMFVLAGFELGVLLQGQQHSSLSSRQVAMMFAECSLVMLGINALLFFTELLEKVSARALMAAGLLLAMAGLIGLAQHRSQAWLYLGVSLTAAGMGLGLPVVAYLAAGASRRKLGATMGGLAAAAGLGQALGSSVAGWFFGVMGQHTFAWLTLPLVTLLVFLLARPDWWLVSATPSALLPSRQ